MERRIFVRGQTALPCTLELSTGEADRFEPPVLAQFENVSGGGCLLLSAKPLPAGGLIRISVNVGEEGELLLSGRVRHCVLASGSEVALYVVGVEFLDMDQEAHARLFWFAINHGMVEHAETIS